MLKKFIQTLLWRYNYDLSKIYTEETDFQETIKKMYPIKLLNTEIIRIGNKDGDGGYLVPDLIDNIKYSFSLGVGKEISFEEDLIKRNIKCFSADYSVENPNLDSNKFEFTKKYIKTYNSYNSIRFDDWKNESIGNDTESEILLQIDIEGDEYSVIPSIQTSSIKQTKILIVEFHHLTRILNKDYQKYIISCFERILEYFYPVHLHVNNSSYILKQDNLEIPHLLEATFINKKFVNKYEFVDRFPNKLDRPCIAERKEIVVPKTWYKS